MQPQYTPTLWHVCADHDFRTCAEAANCYSYALNQPLYYWSVPGLGYTRRPAAEYYVAYREYFRQFTLDQFRFAIRQGAIDDGLIKISHPDVKEGYYPVALFFTADSEDFDFHWYRGDDNGYWSHKNGWEPVTNLDDAGQPITDPRLGSHKAYPVFGGFYMVPEGGVSLEENTAF